MMPADVALCMIFAIAGLFWLWFVPVIVTSLIVSGGCRGFFGRPVIVWRGIQAPDRVAALVLKTAEGREQADEDKEPDLLNKIRS